jgi:hypothetical protein
MRAGSAARFTACAVIVGMVGVEAGPAHAQDAIGDGRALDRNLDPRTGGVNSPAVVERFDERNLLITNNVFGGRGFRGSVGYTAADDFRGSLGSDDLYDFRAGSGWSAVNLITFGTTYDRLRFGQDLAVVEFRRAGQGTTPAGFAQGLYTPRDLVEARLRLDQMSQAATSGAIEETRAVPTIVGGYVDREGRQMLVQSSSLSGIGALPFDQATQAIGLTPFDQARIIEDAAQAREGARSIGQPFRTSYTDLVLGERIGGAVVNDGGAIVDRVDPRAEAAGRAGEDPAADGTGFERIRTHVAGAMAQREGFGRALDQEFLASVDRELEELRARLAAGGETPAKPPAFPGAPPDAGAAMPGQPAGDDAAAAPPVGATTPRSFEDFGMVLRHGERIDRLAIPEAGRFDELMGEGERFLREGEYFSAERRFVRALRFRPGHPMATVGLAHAQLGAGLHLSAAITLRNLFTYQPEMIDARYDEGLMPNRPRMLGALEAIGARIAENRDLRYYGLLYAYLGHLLGDRAAVVRGLDAITRGDPQDSLSALLRTIWLAPADEK